MYKSARMTPSSTLQTDVEHYHTSITLKRARDRSVKSKENLLSVSLKDIVFLPEHGHVIGDEYSEHQRNFEVGSFCFLQQTFSKVPQSSNDVRYGAFAMFGRIQTLRYAIHATLYQRSTGQGVPQRS